MHEYLISDKKKTNKKKKSKKISEKWKKKQQLQLSNKSNDISYQRSCKQLWHATFKRLTHT